MKLSAIGALSLATAIVSRSRKAEGNSATPGISMKSLSRSMVSIITYGEQWVKMEMKLISWCKNARTKERQGVSSGNF